MLLVCLVALIGSALTLFSGFGLGTVLLPAMALLFPPAEAVAATALVHLLNNLFKGGLVWRQTDWPLVLRFGLPAVVGAFIGASFLVSLEHIATPVFRGELFGRVLAPGAAAVTIGGLMILFALLELTPWFQRLAVPRRWLPLGGLLTGFMGGLTGQQGALRSVFLLKTGLSAPAYIATGVAIAIIIDLARLPAYAIAFGANAHLMGADSLRLLAAATSSAFLGAFIGARYMKKATIGFVRVTVAFLMIAIGLGLILGYIGA